jgi:hypothetical protein
LNRTTRRLWPNSGSWSLRFILLQSPSLVRFYARLCASFERFKIRLPGGIYGILIFTENFRIAAVFGLTQKGDRLFDGEASFPTILRRLGIDGQAEFSRLAGRAPQRPRWRTDFL